VADRSVASAPDVSVPSSEMNVGRFGVARRNSLEAVVVAALPVGGKELRMWESRNGSHFLFSFLSEVGGGGVGIKMGVSSSMDWLHFLLFSESLH
jgi:hypothetical protein